MIRNLSRRNKSNQPVLFRSRMLQKQNPKRLERRRRVIQKLRLVRLQKLKNLKLNQSKMSRNQLKLNKMKRNRNLRTKISNNLKKKKESSLLKFLFLNQDSQTKSQNKQKKKRKMKRKLLKKQLYRNQIPLLFRIFLKTLLYQTAL